MSQECLIARTMSGGGLQFRAIDRHGRWVWEETLRDVIWFPSCRLAKIEAVRMAEPDTLVIRRDVLERLTGKV